MEKVLKAVTVHRTSFERLYEESMKLLLDPNHDIADIQGNLRALEQKMEVMMELDRQLLDLMLEGATPLEDIDAETAIADGILGKYNRLKAKVERSSNKETLSELSNSSHSCQSRRRIKLPLIEFKKFDGDIKDWLSFWAQFKRIHEDQLIETEDKFQYLIQATSPKSRARRLVESYPPTNENYPKVIDCLKSRFGRDDLLVEFYVRQLLKLVLNNINSKSNNNINSKSKLSYLYDQIESQLRSLETLGVNSDTCAAMLYPLVESCLPENTLRVWQRSTTYDVSSSLKNRLDLLMSFLKKEVESEERISLAMSGFGNSNTKHVEPQSKTYPMPTASGLLAKSKSPKCVFCKKFHLSSDCDDDSMKKLSFDEKRKILIDHGRCYICLRFGHLARKCKVDIRCSTCNEKHATIMCSKKTPVSESNSGNSSVTVDNLSNTTHHDETLLQTLVVRLSSNFKNRLVRAIIDTGSQRSYIVKHTAIEMKYDPVGSEQLIHALFGGTNSEISHHNRYRITLKNLDDKYICNFDALDQPLICSNVISVREGPWKNELAELGITISDTKDAPIEILIGADIAGKLFTGKRYSLRCGLVAMETLLGWILMGKIPKVDSDISEASSMLVSSLFCNNDISQLWDLETLGISDPGKKKERKEIEADIMNNFLESICVNSDGRYEVGLTWIDGHPPLVNNSDMVSKRLENLMKKLGTDGYYDIYNKTLLEWVNEGIIEEICPIDSENGFYLPHRHVVKLSSATTKLRPVFDASARNKNQPSLNQCLEKGINFIELIPSILIRFRLHEIGVVSDIKKVFLQISLRKTDRDFLRFLWIDKEGKLKCYRHTRVVFGVTSSPFLLAAVIKYHLGKLFDQCGENFRFSGWVISKLVNSFYVDNCVASVNNEEELQQFISESTQVMLEGKFDLQRWEHTLMNNSLTNGEDTLTPVLGLHWNTTSDTLQINFESLKNVDLEKVTKRSILSFSHRLFDPVGFCCPVMIFPRLLIQKTWELNISWDAEVPEEIKGDFLSWLYEIQILQQLRVPRWFLNSKSTVLSLHMFCDASRDAYATVMFLRSISDAGPHIQLVQAKNRIYPMKKMTIPRLELLAATIGARLLNSVVDNFEIKDIPVYCWTDSSTVLSWIRRDDLWKPFVWNRVQEIRSVTDKDHWLHVPGDMNPADLPSRGCSLKKLIQSQWWEGPEWLRNESDWPEQNYEFFENDIMIEKRKNVDSLLNIRKDISIFYRHFSKYQMILNEMGWIQRFIFNCRFPEKRMTGKLSVEEVENAKKILIRLIQHESFDGVEDKRLFPLCPFKDDEGIIRIKTKITERDDTNDFLFPILLPSKHPVVDKIVEYFHFEGCHVGILGLLSRIRQKFWIIRGRRTLKNIIGKCVICCRHDSKRFDVDSVTLPKDRVRDAAVFEIVGIDLAGPLFLKSKEKVWICIFTCAIYRAIHIELVSSLSTEIFLLALRRFIARRGRPSVIYSDNGTNFIGADNLMRNLDWEKIQEESTTQIIKWKFNPPGSPWWGGWWERLIRILKQLLRKQLGKACLTYEELFSVLCECESVINSRPLTYITDTKEELVVLTPSMFLQDIKEIGTACLDEIDGSSMRRHLKYIQKIRSNLRKRFREEYLSQLVLHMKRHTSREVKLGEIVLIENEHFKRLDWPLGIVEEIFPGKDGKIRLVKVRTSTGSLMRPIQRLFPLEIETDEDPGVRCNLQEDMKKRFESEEVDNNTKEPKSNTSENNETNIREETTPVGGRKQRTVTTRFGREVKPPARFGVKIFHSIRVTQKSDTRWECVGKCIFYM